jgi:tRNA (cmo5U34)-methyltransferase
MMTTAGRSDVVWKNEALVRTFLGGVRGGIPYANDQIAILLRLLRARGTQVEAFADLGCGSGVLARAILSEYPNAKGVLVDFSEPMLRAAQEELSTFSGQLNFVHGDLAAMDWASAGEDLFDAIVSGFAIHHLTHECKRELYREIYDHLKPNGMFINIEHVASATRRLEHDSDELLIDSLYAFHQESGSRKTREQVRVEFVHRPDKVANILAPVETQCEWLREIGFQDVDCFFKVFELAVFGGRRSE